MHTVNIHEAKTHLSRLLAKVAAGEEIIIAKSGKPIACLVPYSITTRVRVFGKDKKLLEIPEDFDAPLPEGIIEDFEQ